MNRVSNLVYVDLVIMPEGNEDEWGNIRPRMDLPPFASYCGWVNVPHDWELPHGYTADKYAIEEAECKARGEYDYSPMYGVVIVRGVRYETMPEMLERMGYAPLLEATQ